MFAIVRDMTSGQISIKAWVVKNSNPLPQKIGIQINIRLVNTKKSAPTDFSVCEKNEGQIRISKTPKMT